MKATVVGRWSAFVAGAGLLACGSLDPIQHDLEAKDWDHAFIQALDELGRPRGPIARFTAGAASTDLEPDDAAIMVFGMASARLPARPGLTVDLSSSDAVQFLPGQIEIRGLSAEEDQGYFGFDQELAHLLLAPLEASPYLDRVGPLPVIEGTDVPAGFEATHLVSLPHQFGCPTESRLVPAEELRFEFPEAPGFSPVDLIPVTDEVAFLIARGGGMARMRKGMGSGAADFFWPWTNTSSLAASPEHLHFERLDPSSGLARFYVAAEDGRMEMEGAGRLFSVDLPLEGDLGRARIEELTDQLPVDPVLGVVPYLRGVAVSADGSILVGGGDETSDGRRHGYLAGRGPGESQFTRILIEGWSGSERVDVVTLVSATESLFALAATSGHVLLLRHGPSGWAEVGPRYHHGLGGPAGGEAAEWRLLRAHPRADGFELWGAAKPGLLVQRMVDGTWSTVGDEVRDRRLADEVVGGCSRFGWLSPTDLQSITFADDEVLIGPRDCDSLLRFVFDEDRRVACVSAILPEGRTAAQALDPGFFALARWGDEVLAGEGKWPPRLYRVVQGR